VRRLLVVVAIASMFFAVYPCPANGLTFTLSDDAIMALDFNCVYYCYHIDNYKLFNLPVVAGPYAKSTKIAGINSNDFKYNDKFMLTD